MKFLGVMMFLLFSCLSCTSKAIIDSKYFTGVLLNKNEQRLEVKVNTKLSVPYTMFILHPSVNGHIHRYSLKSQLISRYNKSEGIWVPLTLGLKNKFVSGIRNLFAGGTFCSDGREKVNIGLTPALFSKSDLSTKSGILGDYTFKKEGRYK